MSNVVQRMTNRQTDKLIIEKILIVERNLNTKISDEKFTLSLYRFWYTDRLADGRQDTELWINFASKKTYETGLILKWEEKQVVGYLYTTIKILIDDIAIYLFSKFYLRIY